MPAVVETIGKKSERNGAVERATFVFEPATTKGEKPHYVVTTPSGDELKLSPTDPAILTITGEIIASATNEIQTGDALALARRVAEAFEARGVTIGVEDPLKALATARQMMATFVEVEELASRVKVLNAGQTLFDGVARAYATPAPLWFLLNPAVRRSADMIADTLTINGLESFVTDKTLEVAKRMHEMFTEVAEMQADQREEYYRALGLALGGIPAGALEAGAVGTGRAAGGLVNGAIQAYRGERSSK